MRITRTIVSVTDWSYDKQGKMAVALKETADGYSLPGGFVNFEAGSFGNAISVRMMQDHDALFQPDYISGIFHSRSNRGQFVNINVRGKFITPPKNIILASEFALRMDNYHLRTPDTKAIALYSLVVPLLKDHTPHYGSLDAVFCTNTAFSAPLTYNDTTETASLNGDYARTIASFDLWSPKRQKYFFQIHQGGLSRCGGKVNFNEDILEAGKREFLEEAGISVEPKNFVACVINPVPRGGCITNFIFFAESDEEPDLRASIASGESEGGIWMSIEEILALNPQKTRTQDITPVYRYAHLARELGGLQPLSLIKTVPYHFSVEGWKDID